jgi:hypothetical protein
LFGITPIPKISQLAIFPLQRNEPDADGIQEFSLVKIVSNLRDGIRLGRKFDALKKEPGGPASCAPPSLTRAR